MTQLSLYNNRRVVRGGSWYYVARYCRSASRDQCDPGLRLDALGFRIVKEASPKKNPPRRVVRGGSWDDRPGFLRSAFRSWGRPEDRGFYVGFRLLKEEKHT